MRGGGATYSRQQAWRRATASAGSSAGKGGIWPRCPTRYMMAAALTSIQGGLWGGTFPVHSQHTAVHVFTFYPVLTPP